MHLRHRTWFPFILIGLTLALLLVIIVIFPSNNGSNFEEVEILTEQEYQDVAIEILSNYHSDQNTQVAYESLLALRIPAEYKDLHLDLVLLFGKLFAGEDIDLNNELSILEDQNNWIPIQE